LVVGPVGRDWWAWISGARPFEPAEEAVVARVGRPPQVGVAVGLPGYGGVGFRAAHRQALGARRIAGRTPGLLRYADVAVELLVGENQEDAGAFLACELRGLDDDSQTSRRIRETLTAYFAAEHNAASAAASLGVHQQTVANRLRAAEDRLGHSIGSRRVEIELALRLRATLNRPDS
jgi:DNA-binding PucR family transcriptional regulator